MEINALYRIQTEDFDAVVETLTECFYDDPLYCALIPSPALRRKILPDVFDCDANEISQYCDMYADSEDVNGLIMLEDPSEHKDLRKLIAERYFAYVTENRLAEDDETGITAENFRKAKDFLSSDWVKRVNGDCIHIIYFAVRKEYHGTGLAHRLISPVLDHADQNGLKVALETHNAHNLAIYEHYGFKLFDKFKGEFGLTEYCLVRDPKPANGSDTTGDE